MNGTFLIQTGGDSKYIGRIYECENGNRPRIVREIEIAERLSQCGLSFRVPEYVPLPGKKEERIAAVSMESQQHYAVLMNCIEGVHPDPNDPSQQYESGRALAELDIALSQIPPEEGAGRNPSYFEPERFHPLIDRIERLAGLIPAAPYGDGWTIIEAFAKGYFSLLHLQEKEIEAMPTLIRLRRLVMLICFTARYVQRYDSASMMDSIVDWMLKADRWLSVHASQLTEKLHSLNQTAARG